MSEPDLHRRPLPLTVACLVLVGVGASMFVSLTTLLADWGSLELQEAVESALESDVGLDMSVTTALSWLRIVCLALVVLTIAVTVLAIWAMRGDRTARVALTVLCALGALLLSLAGTATLLPAMAMVGAIVVLWSAESRVWFDVRNGREPSPALLDRARRGRRPAMPPLYPGASAHGLERFSTAREIAPPPPPPPPPPPGAWGPAPAVRTPRAVTSAAVVMLVGSVLAGGLAAGNALMYVAREIDPELVRTADGSTDLLVEVLYGIDRSDRAVAITVGVSLLLALVALAGLVASIALLTNRRSAVLPALVLSHLTVVLGVATLYGAPFAAAAVATVVLLGRPESRAWRATPDLRV